jgi:glutamate synthase domain-containing protein 3
MTGGTVVVLGPTGRNFAAGMSGGVAYVLDVDGDFAGRCNTAMVELRDPTDDDLATVRALVVEHRDRTGSAGAAALLARWSTAARAFVQVMPVDYARVHGLERRDAATTWSPVAGNGAVVVEVVHG